MSVLAVSLTAFLYTLVYLFLIFGGGQPYKPWLNLPIESYYKYNLLFCAPTMFLGWILCAGTIHTLARTLLVHGTFEQLLCLFGFGISIATWTTGVHDIITSFLGALHIIDQRNYEIQLNSPTIWRTVLWILMLAYVLLFIFYFTLATKIVYRLKLFPAFCLGTLGFMVYQLFFLIFNR